MRPQVVIDSLNLMGSLDSDIDIRKLVASLSDLSPLTSLS